MGIEDRKRREFQRRERDILDAALSLLGGDDWRSVTVEAIAERAEVGKGTVYKHFDSKEEIYAQLALDFQRLLLRRLETVRTGPAAGGRIRPIIRALWETNRAHPEYHRILEYATRAEFVRNLPARLQREWQENQRRQLEIYLEPLREGVAAGEFPDLPVEQLFVGPQATVNGAILALWSGWFDRPDADPEAYIDAICAFVAAGLAGLAVSEGSTWADRSPPPVPGDPGP